MENLTILQDASLVYQEFPELVGTPEMLSGRGLDLAFGLLDPRGSVAIFDETESLA